MYSMTSQQNIENHNLRHLGTQTTIEDTSLRNSIGSTQQQLPENDHCNIGRAITDSVQQQTLSSPPAYDDVARHSSTTIIMEQQSLLPPSYDDFIRENNQREKTDV
ncbi:unnamed protein product [Rotaria sp. Silwood1]|nr:unnamed protein product [Rotaria sp. Silwood1]